MKFWTQTIVMFAIGCYILDVLGRIVSVVKRRTAKNNLERKQAEDLMADLRSLKKAPRQPLDKAGE